MNRGVDDEGNCGNFVEKEQILTVGRKQISFVQVSGTIPIFWEQFGVKEETNITRPVEMTHKAFKLHMKDLIKTYGRVTVLNLLKTRS